MLHLPRTVTASITLAVTTADATAEVAGELRYDPSDPFAVTLVVCPELESAVEWVFARELLSQGVAEPAGQGDVTIEPAARDQQRMLQITLATDKVASLLTPMDRIVEFLVETYALVPSGCELEMVDVDAAIAQLFV
jgi:hypothetical protein